MINEVVVFRTILHNRPQVEELNRITASHLGVAFSLDTLINTYGLPVEYLMTVRKEDATLRYMSSLCVEQFNVLGMEIDLKQPHDLEDVIRQINDYKK
jgi:hypothetical protein